MSKNGARRRKGGKEVCENWFGGKCARRDLVGCGVHNGNSRRKGGTKDGGKEGAGGRARYDDAYAGYALAFAVNIWVTREL